MYLLLLYHTLLTCCLVKDEPFPGVKPPSDNDTSVTPQSAAEYSGHSHARSGNAHKKSADGKYSVDKPWVHDKFFSSSPTAERHNATLGNDFYKSDGRLEGHGTESYQLDYRTEQDRLSMSLRHPGSPGSISASDEQLSQAIKARVMAGGVTEQEYSKALAKYADEVNGRYKDTPSSGWRRWKIEKMIWSFFCEIGCHN